MQLQDEARSIYVITMRHVNWHKKRIVIRLVLTQNQQ